MRKGQNPSEVLEGAARARRASSRSTRCPTGVDDRCRSTTAPTSSTPRSTPCSTTSARARCSSSLVLFVFLLSLRASLVVTLVIPLSLAASFIYLHARGMSANLLSMGAVDFGIIVDGAVILVEHVFEHAAGPELRQADRRQRDRQADPRSPRAGRAADAVLAADHRRGVPADLRAPARRGPDLRADGAHRRRARWSARCCVSFTLVPVLCFFALRRHGKVRDVAGARGSRARVHDPVLRRGDARTRSRSRSLCGSASWSAARARAAARQRVLARAQRGLDLRARSRCRRRPRSTTAAG